MRDIIPYYWLLLRSAFRAMKSAPSVDFSGYWQRHKIVLTMSLSINQAQNKVQTAQINGYAESGHFKWQMNQRPRRLNRPINPRPAPSRASRSKKAARSRPRPNKNYPGRGNSKNCSDHAALQIFSVSGQGSAVRIYSYLHILCGVTKHPS